MKNIKQIAIASMVGLVLAAGVSYAAWRGPSDLPPKDNAPAPINVSANPQKIDTGKVITIGNGGVTENLKIIGQLNIAGSISVNHPTSSSLVPVAGNITSTIITDEEATFMDVVANGVSTGNLIVEKTSILKGRVGLRSDDKIRARLDVDRDESYTGKDLVVFGHDKSPTGNVQLPPAITFRGYGNVIRSSSDIYFDKNGGMAADRGLWFFINGSSTGSFLNEDGSNNPSDIAFHFSKNAEFKYDANRIELATISSTGTITALGDVCTKLNGGKCLSSVGGTTSASTPVPAGLYGWCSLTRVRDFEEGICDYRSPASCSATKKQCLCPAGYEKVRTGITDAGLGGVGNVEYYTCYKN